MALTEALAPGQHQELEHQVPVALRQDPVHPVLELVVQVLPVR